MGLTFYEINNKQDDGQCTASSVSLIPKFMGLPRIEDISWACTYSMPYGNGLVETDLPIDKEDGSHVVIICLYHLENLPKIINTGWGVSVSEPSFTSDGVKSEFRHELPEAIGEWIFLLIKGDYNPPPPHLPSRAGGN